jgi:catechol 2,3-dioxygenase-like lactoylglutathione lyase family enzyme
VQKAVDFYQGLFGMPILTKQDAGINLSTGSGFYGLYPAPANATTGSINHVCFGMENFDADAVLKQLTDRGVKGNIRLRGDTKELYFTDPDGIRVQLQDVKYIGGTGVLGDKPPK